MPIIGPSFADELKAAGCTTDGYTWGPGGKITFTDVSEEERAKILAVLAAHDGPLSEARHEAREATNAEASRRIAEMFLRPPQSLDLVWAEINATARAVQILNKKIEGTALPEERLDLDALDGVYSRVTAIRQAGDAAKAALRAAKSVEEVEAVRPGWPE